MAEEIKQGNNKFYVGEDENNPKAEITYKQVDNNEIEIDHTGVSDELGGQGLGTKLVDAVVEHARQKIYYRFLSICKRCIRKNDSYQDVYLG